MCLWKMSKKITPEQKKTLLQFLEEHEELVQNKQTNQFTNADNARLWQEVALKLNAIPGAQKSWKEWRKAWSDLKTRTKKKLSDSKKEANKTGGGPNNSEIVDDFENRIIDIIGGDVVIEGLDTPELGIPPELPLRDWDHQYFQEDIPEIEEISPYELNNNENMDPALPANETPKEKKFLQERKRVRPPLRTQKKRINNSTNKAAFDLVAVTERTNKIKETYYNKKIELEQKKHEDNLKLRKEEIQLRKKEIELKEEELIVRKQELAFNREYPRLDVL